MQFLYIFGVNNKKTIMKKQKSARIHIVGILTMILFMNHSANAVAFKLKNDTKYSVRAKVYDRGAWRSYIQIDPGECIVFGSSVERTEHDVIIQMNTEDGWKTIYENHHGSRLFTRIVRISESNNKFYFAWYDEPPGCRDCPSGNGHGCLKKSGDWINFKNAVKLGEFLGKVVMLVGA